MKNVLVVDDNAIVRRHLKGLLERDGCLVCEAADGQLALDFLDARSFDVMFLDLHMPGMDGTEVLKAMAERELSVPVVLITSSESSGELVRAFRMGAKDTLAKPFRAPLVRRAMEKATGLDFTTIQRTCTDIAFLDSDEGLAQELRDLASDEVHQSETVAEVPACVRRPHQLVFIGRLDGKSGASDAEAEAIADLVAQHDPWAFLVRLLPPGRALPELTMFHFGVSRDDAGAIQAVWRAVRSGGAMAAGRLVRALHFDGPADLEFAYWWTLRSSLETAFRTLAARGPDVTLDLSLTPENEPQLARIVDWALEYAERTVLDLTMLREPVPPGGVPPPAGATRLTAKAASVLARHQVSPRTELPRSDVSPVVSPVGSPDVSPSDGAAGEGPRRGGGPIEIPGFELGTLIGQGGMSRVYRATQLSLGREVCVKVMRDEVASDPALVERFRDEGVALATLRHPNIVSVLDVGKSRDGHLYMVMEYVDGEDLRALVRHAEHQRLPVARTIELMAQLLSGLTEAHAHGIIHRDLKPSNVLVTTLRDETPLVKLVDFGIAKVLEGLGRRPGQTRVGTVIGTPGYMAPEQLLGMEVSCATDLYAVGVLLFELVTGRRPLVAKDEFELAQATMTTPAPHLRDVLGAGVPDALDELLTALLAKNPRSRPQSAAEVRAALLAVPMPVAA